MRIRRLHARYRLPAGEPEGRARLDRALRRALDEVLEPALAAAGVPAREEVCIRALSAPARLHLADGEDALATAWGTALAAAVRRTLDAGGPGVVRYSSRAHGLADVVAGVAAGDLARAWAWRQVGLWTAADALAPDAAVTEAVGALRTHPSLSVAVLADAARSGALARLAPRLTPAHWTALARAALEAAGVPDGAAADLLVPPPGVSPPRDGGAGEGASRADPGPDAVPDAVSADASGIADVATSQAAAVVRASSIAAAAAPGRLAALPPSVRRAVAVLAVLEVDPAAFAAPPARGARLVREVERATGEPERDGIAGAEPPQGHDPAAAATAIGAGLRATGEGVRTPPDADACPSSPAVVPERMRGAPDAGDAPAPDARAPVDAGVGLPEHPSPAGERSHSGAAASPGESGVPAPATVARVDGSGAVEAADGPAGPKAVRSTGDTRWGGLLFLLHLVRELDLPAAARAKPLDARPLRWVLHALAGTLLALDARDPAALAFAGVPPHGEPPSHGAAPATPEETAALEALGRRLQDALHERLDGAAQADARTAHALLRQVTRRTATVEADPGWFDVRLAFDEVSVDVRRAGLDLDPGWLPWLGVAVRFVYV